MHRGDRGCACEPGSTPRSAVFPASRWRGLTAPRWPEQRNELAAATEDGPDGEETAHTPNARSFVTTRVGGQGGHPASYWGWCMYGSVTATVLLMRCRAMARPRRRPDLPRPS